MFATVKCRTEGIKNISMAMVKKECVHMTKEELKAFAEGEGSALFQEITSEMGLSKIDKSTVENFFKTDEGKSLLFSKYDTEHARRMKKYKEEGGFQKDFDAEYQKRNPQMTPEQKELMDYKSKIAEYERKEKIQNNFKELSGLNDNYRLPKRVFDMLVGEDLDLSRKQIEEIGAEFSEYTKSAIENGINEKLAGSGKPLPSSDHKEPKKTSVFDDILNGRKS